MELGREVDHAAVALHRFHHQRRRRLGRGVLDGLTREAGALEAAGRVGQLERAAVAVGLRDPEHRAAPGREAVVGMRL